MTYNIYAPSLWIITFLLMFFVLKYADWEDKLQGLALSSVGEYKKAEEAHKKAIQIDQKFLEAWGHLAQVLIRCWITVFSFT